MNLRRHHLAALWLGLAWLAGPLAAHAAGARSPVYISEFLAENRGGIKDEDGEHHGWIEIHNSGAKPVNLEGGFLTDSPTNPAKWRLPAVTLLPDKYLLVFASGKNRTNPVGRLHTNFRLPKLGGYLALANPAGKVVSEFSPYPLQFTDISFGCARTEPELTGPFLQPTPGKPNAIQGRLCAPEVRFSRPGGTFTEPWVLKLECPGAGVVIRYTLDGALPDSQSPIYEAPLRLTNSVQVTARAYQKNRLPGPPASAAYLLLHTNALSFKSNLPLLIMDTFGRKRPTSAKSAAVHLTLFEPANGVATLTNPVALSTRAGFHERGSTSRGMPQRSFALEFLDEFDDDRDLGLLGMPPGSDWVLYAPNSFDPVMIHNPFAHQLSRDMGCYSPRTRFVEVFLAREPGPVTADHYHGLYVLEEKIAIGKHRVNIDRLGANDLQPPAVTGGYLLKIDRLGPGEQGLGAAGVQLVFVDPKEPVIRLPQRAPQLEYLRQYFRDFERALNGPHWKDPAAGYRAYLDERAWIDFHVLEVLTGNVDALALSTYFYKPRGGKITFGPHWDFDRALGSTDGRDANPRHWQTGPYFGAAWWNRLFQDVDFWQLWVDRWQELRRTHFSQPNLEGLIDRLTGELREAQPRQARRWGLQPRGGSYQSEINHMKNWLSNRVDFIDRQLTPPPRLSHAGGAVAAGFTLALSGATNAVIYYTLDGSDPRLPQGGIAANAVPYAGPIVLRSNAQVVARAHNPKQHQTGGPPVSTPWSSPVSARFTVKPR